MKGNQMDEKRTSELAWPREEHRAVVRSPDLLTAPRRQLMVEADQERLDAEARDLMAMGFTSDELTTHFVCSPCMCDCHFGMFEVRVGMVPKIAIYGGAA